MYFYNPYIKSAHGGIGRHASLRGLCPYGRAGSTPVARTFFKFSTSLRLLRYSSKKINNYVQ